MNNEIDTMFYNLIDFIKKNDITGMKNAIKHNFDYMRKTDSFNYHTIADYYNKQKLWGSIDSDNNNYELIENNAKSLVEHCEDYEWLYQNLGDYRSKKILNAILYYWLSLDYKKISELEDKTYNQYFDLDIIKCDNDEVFVDVGSYIGDTVVSYIQTYGKDKYKKIYCYEISPANIKYIYENIKIFELENIVVKEKGAGSKKGTLYLSDDVVSSTITLTKTGKTKVKVVRIDEDIDDEVTFIKMDIEGGEEEALLGCHDLILKYHPKLSLCVYHNNDHLWKLARIIHEIDPTYKFYLRYYGGPLLPLEYILYAI